MTNHGFGAGKLQSSKAPLPTKRRIAQCISDVPGVVWAHVVHRGFHYFSTRDGETRKKHESTRVQDLYDLIFEMERPCNPDAIAACARAEGHGIEIDVITIEDDSFKKGKIGKHPKATD
jgi:hypothetical protein